MRANAWHLVVGLTLWFAWFCATYGGLAVACAVAPPAPVQGAWTWLNLAVLLLAALFSTAFAVAAWASARANEKDERQRFMARAATALYTTAALATLMVAMPAVVMTPCV
jgi:cell division protein FtsW (lipid II flippase)